MKGKNRNIYHIGNNDEIKIITLARKSLNSKKECKNYSFEATRCETKRRCPSIKKLKVLAISRAIQLMRSKNNH